MQNSKINLADAIREARTKCGLSQEKLAEAVGLSNHAIIKIESGEGNPKFENLYKIVTYLKMSTDRIFYPETKNERPNLQRLTMELSDCSEDEAERLLPAVQYLLELMHK